MAPDSRLQVEMVTDEADAVLAILDKRAAGETAGEEDWQRLFSTEGYRRLEAREAAMQRPFDHASFRDFVFSADLLERRPALRRTLGQWRTVDPAGPARRAFAYLPESAVIRARVYPSIKPRTNSFVFETSTNPAIFLYLDPKVGPAKLENTVAHELHHIGVGSVCSEEAAGSARSENVKTTLQWMSGFAEGRAVYAAAGPDVHPHATSDAAERAVWERDFAKVGSDLPRLETFFTALLDGKLPEEERNRQGMSFVATEDVPQGPYYTVGWLMFSVVERELGRKRLVESLCDPAMFLTDYNRAAAGLNRRDSRQLPLWSRNFLARLPADPPPRGRIPPAPAAPERAEMADRVKAEILHAWRGYERYAWGHDELKPVTKAAHDWHGEPLLMTPVDSLDTLLIAGLKDEASKAKALIVERLSFDRDIEVKNFEITIRLLGGLLSGHEMTGDERLLRLAEDLGNRLLPVFESPTGMPYMYVNLKTGKTRGAVSNPAEIGTLVLEFGTLARLTGRPVFLEKARRAMVELDRRRSKIDLPGEEIDVETGRWKSRASHVGGGIDSYYEYLLKCSLLFGDADCGTTWRRSVRALNRHLADDAPTGMWYGQVDADSGRRTASEFGALHAFLPGVLALGGDLPRARRLQDSCFRMWKLHGIEPEVLDYRAMKVLHAGYPLRPEIVESAYVLYRKTKDPKYLEMGRTFFDSLVAHCRTDAGYTVLKNVVTKEKGDLMPSYFLAETLKYLYLLFAPEGTLDLDAVVFNTEAHPLRRTR